MLRSALPERPEARRVLLGTLFSAFGNGMTLPFLFVYLHEVRGIDATIVGLVSAWMGLLGLLAAGPVGSLIDRFGVRRIVLPIYAMAGLGQLSWAFVHTPWQAFFSATIASCGSASFLGMNTLISSVTSEEERHRTFSLNFVLLNLGLGLGAAIAGFIANVDNPDSFKVLYTVDACSWIVPAAVLLSLPHIGHRLVSKEAAADAGGYREVLSDRPFRRLVLFTFILMACGYAQFEIGFPAFATTVGEVSTQVVAWGLVGNTVVIVLGQLTVTDRLTGRSRSKSLALAAVAIAVAWLILGVGCFGKNISTALPVLGVVVGVSVFALAETIFSPLLPALTNALATDELRGRYNAMGSMMWGVTAIIGPLTAAPLIGNNLGGIWLAIVVGGAVVAALVARSLRGVLTPAQDGRELAEVEAGVERVRSE